MNLRTFAVVALVFAACSAQAAEKFYKWKDETGAWHYTRTPPPAGAESSNVQVHGAPPSTGASETAAPAPSASPAAGGSPTTGTGTLSVAANADRKAQCDKARAYAATLNDNQFVAVDSDGDGQPELMSDEQKRKELERAQLAVKLACE
jgi:hypothetical protein